MEMDKQKDVKQELTNLKKKLMQKKIIPETKIKF